MEIITKTCVFCNINQPIINFIKNKKCSLGVNNKCKSCQKLYRHNYNKNNKDKILEYNIEYNKVYNKKWNQDKKHIIKWRSILYRCLIYKGKNKNSKTESMLGYSLAKFKQHIENQFQNGMSWNNIHVDHKIPLTWFKPDTPVWIINHLDNIHPLFSSDNISKLNRYSHNISSSYALLVKEWILDKYLDKIT